MTLSTTPNNQRLYQGQPGVSEAALYTVASRGPTASSRGIVSLGQIVATNTGGAAATVSLSIVPAGATAGPGNRVLAGASLAPGSTTVYAFDQPLGEGDFISGLQGTAGAVTLLIAGLLLE